jgi:hypothetical protein
MAPKTALLPFAAFVLLAFSLQAASGLIDRGNGLIYDDVLDITWLQNADLFATQEGPHYNNDWVDQVLWIDNLVYAGFNDWRPASMSVSASAGQPWAPWAYAPSIVDCDPTSGTTEAECMDNELGYMYFYNLDGILGRTDFGGDPGHFDSGIDITTPSGITFRNLNTTYYSSTTMQFIFDPLFYDTSFGVWGFYFSGGFQGFADPGSTPAFWAVRDGDSVTINLPNTAALMLLAILSLVARRTRGTARSGWKQGPGSIIGGRTE